MGNYDALVVVSFGGPERPEDVLPFLENVVRGRGVPRERLLAVEAHYQRFGGVSPINQQCRELVAALEGVVDVPVYWGNRNWHPYLTDTVRQMAADGVRRAAAFATAATSSYSSCRQYIEDIARATREVQDAPRLVKLPHFYDHPGFIAAMTDRTRAALDEVGEDARLVFTAHSVPLSMAAKSGPRGGAYEAELRAASALVAQACGTGDFDLVWQSRSGPPQVPWLEPDVCDHLEELHAQGTEAVVLVPIGFVSDHMEVRYDLDLEAAAKAAELGLRLARAGTAGTHPRFVSMIKELMDGPEPVPCPVDCCVIGSGRPARTPPTG
ncbi:ferrochelatase [Acrocarpospora corrugata]|uniref:Coproporphyrin III ferrochelatase n=1 Tax=Acrocarpospora corrugata TaxID=35763 RepID=A0A5M3VNT5_9ACTN|nr:ferrochelatase [Acrocarpospora corrugata]GER98446.1 ferrochelatase [Acrocarpospora corrugata]